MASENRPIISPVLVGRAREVAILEAALYAVQQGAGQLVLLSGEAGVGKSRLVAEIHQRALAQNFIILEGQCFERDRHYPYAPLIDALRMFFAAQSASVVADQIGVLGAELVKLLPELVLVVPSLQPSPALDPEAEKRRLFEALLHFLVRLTQQQPARQLFLTLEDIHWGDETSLDFLHLLARRISAYPIFLLATYRHDELSPALKQLLLQLDRSRMAPELRLPALKPRDVNAMLQMIFEQAEPVRTEFLDAIYELTEGNPFFVEEVLKALVSSGDVFYAERRWDRKPIEELHIPPSVQDAVNRRTSQLSDEARRLLTWAAVAGQRFDFVLLQQLSGRDEGELLALMKELVTAQLVVGETTERFAFRHALTRQAVYAELLGRERQVLHQRVALAIEQIHEDTLKASTGPVEAAEVNELSYHFYGAGDWNKVLVYAWRAGSRAQALYAQRATVEHFSRALQAVQYVKPSEVHQADEELVVKLYRGRGLAYATLGEFEEARTDLEFALAQARVGEERSAEWQLLLDLGYLWASRDYPQSGDYFQQALTLARILEDGAMLAHSLKRVGNWHTNLEEPQEALACHQEALAIFQALNDPRGLAETYDLLGMTSLLGSDYVQSASYFKHATTLFETVGDLPGMASSLASLSACGYKLYITEVAVWANWRADGWLNYGERALQIAQEIGWRGGEVYALMQISAIQWGQGQVGRGLEMLQRALALAHEIEHRQWSCAAHSQLGTIYLDLLALPESKHHLEQALRLANETGSLYLVRLITKWLVLLLLQEQEFAAAHTLLDATLNSTLPLQTLGQRSLWQARAELALAQGDPSLALQITDQLIAFTANIESSGISAVPHLAYFRAKSLDALRRWAEAEAMLLDAQKGAQAQGSPSLLWRVHLLLGQVVRARGRHSEASTHFAAARQVIETISATLPDAELRDNFVRQATARIPQPRSRSPLQVAKQAHGGLTRREREVAHLVAQGSSNRAIAEALILGERTVESYVASILAKLNFSSRSQIAAWAVESGLTKGQKS
jgi:DNA-binding CsgD family transcriptional regulator/tetratricopeptide (TPR) repeat protein